LPERLASQIAGLSLLELDALRELANVGAGHAATALSRMTARRVAVTVPTVAVASAAAVAELLLAGPEPAVAVALTAQGSFAARFVVALTDRHARGLADLLLGGGDAGAPPHLAESALQETGNVLAGAFLAAMSSITGWCIPFSPPLLVRVADSAGAALVTEPGCALCLETSFSVDGGPPVRGHLLLFPRHDTVTGLRARIAEWRLGN